MQRIHGPSAIPPDAYLRGYVPPDQCDAFAAVYQLLQLDTRRRGKGTNATATIQPQWPRQFHGSGQTICRTTQTEKFSNRWPQVFDQFIVSVLTFLQVRLPIDNRGGGQIRRKKSAAKPRYHPMGTGHSRASLQGPTDVEVRQTADWLVSFRYGTICVTYCVVFSPCLSSLCWLKKCTEKPERANSLRVVRVSRAKASSLQSLSCKRSTASMLQLVER